MLTALLLLASAPDSLHVRIARNDSALVAAVSRPVSEWGKGRTQAQIDSGAARYLRANGIVVGK
jgi:hypothetical protein